MSDAADGGTVRASLSEIDALCRKAARGAGHPWGLAEEAGRAARDLAAAGADGPAAVLDALRALGDVPASRAPRPGPDGRWSGEAGAPLCPIAAGAALSDRAHRFAPGEVVALERVVRPALLLPALARARPALPGGFGIERAALARASGERPVPLVRVRFGPPDGAFVDALAAVAGAPGADAARDPGSIPAVDAEVWRALEALAHRTYVPASEASRRAAGGSGEDG